MFNTGVQLKVDHIVQKLIQFSIFMISLDMELKNIRSLFETL